MAEIHITQALVKKMYNELSEEIKKDEYNNTYAWYNWSPIILNDNIERSIYFSQRISSISYIEEIDGIDYGEIINESRVGKKYIIVFYEDYDENLFKLDDVKKVMQGIIDFEKMKELENDGEIYNISLQKLLDENIILDKNKFLKIYCKTNEVCLLKDIELKKLNITQLVFLYLDLLFNEYSGIVEIIPLESMEQNDIVGKHL